MLNKKVKEWLILTLKVILSLTAIIYILNRISISDIADVLISARIPFLGFAFILFVASKIMAAFRTLLILNRYGISISKWYNLKLYWTGMFYNLFLPGGIGGDIYKTAIINNMHVNGLKISAGAVIMDRISGVAALMVLALLCIPFTTLYNHYGWVTFAGIPVTIIGFFCTILVFTPRLKGIIGGLLGWSFMVQVLQVLSVFLILAAFNIKTNQPEYTLIFLISSIAAMLPVSVGGIGIRELVFFSMSDYFFLDQKVAVAISFTFYLITLLASSWGIISALERRRNKNSVSAT